MKHGTAFSVSISVLLAVDFQIGNLKIGYNYLVSFDIKGADEAKGTELFRSPDAVFYGRLSDW